MNKWIWLCAIAGLAYFILAKRNSFNIATTTKKPETIRDIKDADNNSLINDPDLTDAEFWDLINGNDSGSNDFIGSSGSSPSIGIEYNEPSPKTGTVSSSIAPSKPIVIPWIDEMPRINDWSL